MAKMIIMQGLPASGKSTRAKELVAQGNTVRINKDLLRTMLHFDKFTGPNEGKTRQAARELAKVFLTNNTNVIIDDTNLNEGTLQSWKDLAMELGAKIAYERIEADVFECVRRDEKRAEGGCEKAVGASVIVGMALKAGLYPKPQKGIVLCDLDGTLCDISHRLHFVKGETKDWKGFFDAMVNDTLRDDVSDMLSYYLDRGHDVMFVSARPDTYRAWTEDWLRRQYTIPPHTALFMRRAGDHRDDVEVKREIYEQYFKDKYPIETVIDDRPKVIRMWKEEGLNVIDVGAGIEF